MSERTDDLEAPDTWDWSAAEKRPGVPEPGVIVSVRYSAAEFETIAECAEREGLTVTDFVRKAVLEAATGRSTPR